MKETTIHRISYTLQLHGWNLKNVQVDCGEIIADAEILKLPLRKNPGVKEDQTVCTACVDVNTRQPKKIYVRERLKE